MTERMQGMGRFTETSGAGTSISPLFEAGGVIALDAQEAKGAGAMDAREPGEDAPDKMQEGRRVDAATAENRRGTDTGLVLRDTEQLAAMIQTVMEPVLSAMARFMQNSTEALERVAAAQKVQSDRMEALERQIRLNTLLTPVQVRHVRDAVRKRAQELLDGKLQRQDGKAVNAAAAAIRKGIAARYGVGTFAEIPKHEYSVVMEQIATWNDLIVMRDILRKARARADETDA